MGINANDFLRLVIMPSLDSFDRETNHEATAQFLLAVAAQESQIGTNLRQISGGPALGPYQMEPNTHGDIHVNFLSYRPEIRQNLFIASGMAVYHTDAVPPSQVMIYNLRYATLMARIHFLRQKEPLPPMNNPDVQARYWKTFYNTRSGKGDEAAFVQNWNRFVRPCYS